MRIVNYFSGFLVALLLLSACQQVGPGSQAANNLSDTMLSDISNVKKAISDVYYLFPSPKEIISVINKGKIVFDPSLMNSVQNSIKYIKSNDQYLNIGVYLSDLSYCAVFNRGKQSEAYLSVLQNMLNDVNLSFDISNELIERIKDNSSSVDSLAKLSDEYFYKTIGTLEENNRHNDAAIISIGAYIECLYLSVNLVKEYSHDNMIVQKIAEQKGAFNNLFQYSKKYMTNQDLMESYQYIKQINDLYGKFRELETKVEVKNEGESHLVISGGNTTVISESEFKEFKKTLNEIRMKITKKE